MLLATLQMAVHAIHELVEERSRSYCQRTQNHMTSNKMCVYNVYRHYHRFNGVITLVLYFMYRGEYEGMLNHLRSVFISETAEQPYDCNTTIRQIYLYSSEL